ncbi:Ig-like domain-containing protein [Enterococcus durans]|uniref:Ig-like domain-containing protein n=1 Tax=Enterococcus durans TaxID=53345 RepID=UPI001F0EE4C3|nr:Ig-like domain-containing protein [Enterococcus durans]
MISPESVALNKTTLSLAIGANETLTATVLPADATDKTVTWKSSDATIAGVDSKGKVTGVKAGTADITVTTKTGGKTTKCTVKVTEG